MFKDVLDEHYSKLITKPLKSMKRDELVFILTYLDIPVLSVENKKDLLEKMPIDVIRDEILNQLLDDED
jgi:hypothetical protein